MSKHQESFPVLSIDRDDVEYALGFDPELTDEKMEVLTAALHDALQEKGFKQLLDDTLDELEIRLGIVAPKSITIEVEGGVITAVRGLPENYQYEILDHDDVKELE